MSDEDVLFELLLAWWRAASAIDRALALLFVVAWTAVVVLLVVR